MLGPLYETVANPAVQATEPRPEWYFLFLFELLRVFKTPWQLIFATIIIPTIMMVLLIAWPFLDRGRDRRLSRRPAGVALGLTVPAVLIALTMAGAVAPGAGGGTDITNDPAINKLPGTELIVTYSCTSCHFFGKQGAAGPGSSLENGSAMFKDRPGPDQGLGRAVARAAAGRRDAGVQGRRQEPLRDRPGRGLAFGRQGRPDTAVVNNWCLAPILHV